MNSKQANIFAVLSLVLLGLFLAYWVQTEFKTQKEFLKSEMDLELAKKAFGLAVDSLQTELGDIDSLLAKVLSSIGKSGIDNINIEKNRNWTKENLNIKFDKILPQLAQLMADSSFQEILTNSETDTTITNNEEDTLITVNLDSDVSDVIKLNLQLAPLKKSISKNQESELNKKTFLKILPQLFFAIVIFGLILLAMYLFRKTVQRQEALNLERTNLISNLTHELKTPVATISVALEAMENFGVLNDREKAIQYITNAQNEVKRLTKGINKMLQVSKLNEDNPYFKKEMVLLNELCKNAVQALSSTAKQAKVELSVEISDDNLKTYGEAQHLQNVIINLIENAIKYSVSENAKVNLFLKDADEDILLEVIDNGIGIEKKYHHKIFERFYRVTEENIHNVKGYGLGLSYVQKVLDAHEAQITIDSALNKGSKFTILFKKI